MNSTPSATAHTPEPPAAHDPLAEPETAETTGRHLAAQLGDVGAHAVLSWDVTEDAVLGHIVARELHVPLWRAVDVEGIIELFRALPEGTAVVLVADAIRRPMDLTGLVGIVRHYGGRTAGIAAARASAVLTSEAPVDVPVVTAGEPG